MDIFSLRSVILFIVLTVTTSKAIAEEDSGAWFQASVKHRLDQGWTPGLDTQARFDNDFDTLDRYVVRPYITKSLSARSSLTFGYDAHFIQNPAARTEQRLWQQYEHRWSVRDVRIRARLRVEERFIEFVNGVSIRPRFRVGVTIPLFSPETDLILSDEIFVTANTRPSGPKSGLDQNRVFAGVQWHMNDTLTGTIGYQMQYVNRRTTPDLTAHQLFVGAGLAL